MGRVLDKGVGGGGHCLQAVPLEHSVLRDSPRQNVVREYKSSVLSERRECP